MAYVGLPGAKHSFIGPALHAHNFTQPYATLNVVIDATNEACIMIGQIETSDEGTHTIDTTGSSKIEWRAGAVTFANAGTTVKVGIAAVDTTTGPPGRAVNTAGVITFDVSKSMVGGGGGITANAVQSHVPDAGSKTIAHGDLVAICVQATARAGADSIGITLASTSSIQRPSVTSFLSATYADVAAVPNAFITFSDGATGWVMGTSFFSAMDERTFASGAATKEYGQLYQFGFPVKIYGLYGWVNLAGSDFDAILYSNPLSGSPVAEKTISIDANTVASNTTRRFEILFASPFSLGANTPIGAVFKPGVASIDVYYKTLSAATQRVCDVWGTSGYGIGRASGAFANINSSLDHYLIGLIVGAFDAGGVSGRVARVNDISLVA